MPYIEMKTYFCQKMILFDFQSRLQFIISDCVIESLKRRNQIVL